AHVDILKYRALGSSPRVTRGGWDGGLAKKQDWPLPTRCGHSFYECKLPRAAAQTAFIRDMRVLDVISPNAGLGAKEIEMASFEQALEQFEATEANIAKLERLCDEIRALIPNGIEFGLNADYDDKCRSAEDICAHLPL